MVRAYGGQQRPPATEEDLIHSSFCLSERRLGIAARAATQGELITPTASLDQGRTRVLAGL
jgi:hypothetical protein